MSLNRKVAKGYNKYHFASVEKAKEAKEILGKKFPNMKMTTTDNGSLFCHESGSLTIHLLLISIINDLGGIEAEAI